MRRLMVIASAFSAAESLEQALQICAAWPLPEKFFVRFVLPADFAVVTVGAVRFLLTHERFTPLY